MTSVCDAVLSAELSAQHGGRELWQVLAWFLWWRQSWYSQRLLAVSVPSHYFA